MNFLKVNVSTKNKLKKIFPFFRMTLLLEIILISLLLILLIISNLGLKKLSLNDNNELTALIMEGKQEEQNKISNELITKYDYLLRRAYFTDIEFRKTAFKILVFLLLLLLFNIKIIYELKRDSPDLKPLNKDNRIYNYFSECLIIFLLIIFFIISYNKKTKTIETELSKNQDKTYVSSDQLKENWPGFRGYENIGLSYNGRSEKLIKDLSEKWSVSLESQGFNSPIIWEDQIFLSTADNKKRKIFSYDLISGNLNWFCETKNINVNIPKVTADTGLAAATMVTDGEKVAAIFATGELIVVDMKGNVLWEMQLTLPINHYGHSSSLLSYKNLLYIQLDHSESANIYALDFSDGNVVWQKQRDVDICWTSPSIIPYKNNLKQLILIGTPHIISYNPLTGDELWRATDVITGELAPSIAFAENKIFVTNQYSELAALNHETGKVLWLYDENLPDVSSPVAKGKFLILPSSFGAVTCLNSNNKELFFYEELSDEGFYSSPIIKGNDVFLIDKTGEIYIFQLNNSFNLKKKLSLNEEVVATPAFINDDIIIRTTKKLICLEIIYE